MKQMIFSALLLFVSLSVAAQNAQNDSINEKFFNAKVRELTYRLDIKDEQKKDFVAVYRRYNDDMRAVWGGPRLKKGDKKANFQKKDDKKTDAQKKEMRQKRTSADVAAAQKRKMELQQKAQEVQMKYLDEFAKVLDAKQMSKFYEVESKIQKKLMERKHKVQKTKMRKTEGKRFDGKRRSQKKD